MATVKTEHLPLILNEDLDEDLSQYTDFLNEELFQDEPVVPSKKRQIMEADPQENCSHQLGFFQNMCISCGKLVAVENVDALPVNYMHIGLRVGNQDIARIKNAELKTLLRKKKLNLVLDLDHTLLHSTRLDQVLAKNYLLTRSDSKEDVGIYKLPEMGFLTKLRPFVQTFLEEVSSLFELYVYTMGERAYAMKMVQLLDPKNVYFKSKVISRDDCIQQGKKGLDVGMLPETATVILDDTEWVWSEHKDNLILVDGYHFFDSDQEIKSKVSRKPLYNSLGDESESEGALAVALGLLKRVHYDFFNPGSPGTDIRHMLKNSRKEILKDCRVVFTGLWDTRICVEDQRLWKMASELGASCLTKVDNSVTHVVAGNKKTEKACEARNQRKYLVNPQWLEATYYQWKRQKEELFPVC